MRGSLPTLRKVLNLLPIVQANQGIRVADLARMSGISEEEIIGDLPDLVNLCGVPPYSPLDLVDLAVEGDRVSIQFADQFRRPVRLTLREALAVEMALSGQDAEAGDPFGQAVAGIRAKVRAACSPEVVEELSRAGERISASPARGLAGRTVSILKDALLRQVEVELEYFSRSSGRLSRRTIRPYGIYEQRGHWYVVAHDPELGEERTFRADRIRSALPTERDYEIPEDFEVGRYRKEGPVEPEGEVFTAVVRFEPTVERFAREWFPATRFEDGGDGSLLGIVRTTTAPWLVAEILRWGPDAVVLAPDFLRAEVVRQVDEMLKTYGR